MPKCVKEVESMDGESTMFECKEGYTDRLLQRESLTN